MLGIMVPQWMGNSWLPDNIDQDTMRDINGVPIVVGSVVALIGVVTAVNPTARHFDDVTFQTSHPNDPTIMDARLVTAFPKELVVQ